MSLTNGTLVRMGVSAACAGLLVTSIPAVANSQVPGVDPETDRATYVVTTGDERISVAVSTPNTANGTVLVTVQNNTGGNLSCGGFGGGAPVSVAPAEVISRTLDHYSRYAVYPDPVVTTEEIKVGIINGLDPMTIPLASVTDMVPAIAARQIWPEAGSRAVIASKYDEARLAGQTGRHNSAVSIPANSSTSISVPLTHPSRGDRKNFDAAAVVGCTFGTNHVYVGYSPGTPPQGNSGSLSLPGTGRFGS